ncbi:MAG: 4Fe-4S binding protein [Butyricicoccus sp.]|nr:4Fe-4S binding protein [Butyricicoccus sp.]
MNYLICFSPTGGVKRCADAFTAAWDGGWQMIDLCDAKFDAAAWNLTADDLAVVAIPAYGGRMPTISAERFAALQGNGAKIILLCVYGNRAFEDTMIEMFDIATAGGFRPVAAVGAIAEHSMMRQFAAGRPDATDRMELAAYGMRIRRKLEENGDDSLVSVPGNRPYKIYPGSAAKPQANENCGGCGVCVTACPTGAIDSEDPKVTDLALCVGCMRCAAVCPSKARAADPAVIAGIVEKVGAALSGHKDNSLYV